MIRIKSRSSSPAREVEEEKRYDLFTSDHDALRAIESGGTPTNPRKRSNAASGNSRSGKKPRGAASNDRPSQPKAQPKRKSPTKKPTIILGCDFGTTNSGMSYAHSGNGKVKELTRWNATNRDYVKFETAIKFGPPKDIWGPDAKHETKAVRWFKLLLVNPEDLDEDIRTSAQLRKAQDDLKALDMTPVEAISIFLKHMFEHAVEMLKIDLGAVTVDTSRFHLVFTIPAIWPDYARQSMQQAIERSGILKDRDIGPTTYDFVSEPEAAALATLSDLDGLPNLQIGDTIVVVDCGGGTVDIITYKIIKINPMTVQETVAGKGALCGAIFVDERFKDLVVSKLTEICEDAMERVTEQEMQDIMTRHWEDEIRNQFNGAHGTWTIRYPFSLLNAVRLDPNRGYPTFTITSDEVEEVFRPIVEQIELLVNGQIEAAVKKDGNDPECAILVGGFGSSGYLREYLSQRCQGVEILQRRGSEPWSAISRGAVIHGMVRKRFKSSLKVAIKSRIARQSYGVVGEEPWNEGVHHPDDMKHDYALLENVSIRVMKWHVVKGDKVPVDHTISIPFTKFLEDDALPEKITTIVYTSLTDQPSRRQDDSVMRVYEIEWKIRVDWDSLEIFENKNGKRFRKLEYTVQMICGAGATAFYIHHNEVRQAKKHVTLKYS